MKKLCGILITLVLLITCFSCSSNEEASFNTQTKEEDQTTIVEENKQEEDVEVKQDTSNEEVTSTIVDKQEEVKEEIKVLDNGANPNYNYWVTFYDHDGNILQQDAIKYGTVPTYWSDTPYYDDGTNWYKGVGWTDAYGRDVTEFQPIKGNTRFYAKYEVGGAVSHSSSGGGESNPPAPVPDHTQVECLTSAGGASATYIDSLVPVIADMEIVMEAKMNKVAGTRPFGTYQYSGYISRYVGFNAYAYGYTLYAGSSSRQGLNNVGFGTKSTYNYVINGTGATLTINGTANLNYSLGYMPSGNLFIFTFNRNETAADNQPLSIYSLKITKSGVLERDYIAVKTNREIDMAKNATDPTANIPADTLCFYDQQNDMYYLNSGTGEFTSTPIS